MQKFALDSGLARGPVSLTVDPQHRFVALAHSVRNLHHTQPLLLLLIPVAAWRSRSFVRGPRSRTARAGNQTATIGGEVPAIRNGTGGTSCEAGGMDAARIGRW
jgi:hypothetical protein